MTEQTLQAGTRADWMNAKGLTFALGGKGTGHQCALVPDQQAPCDHIAVVYNKIDGPPKITVREVAGSVHQVMADGVAVAVIARSDGPQPRAADVLLVERSC